MILLFLAGTVMIIMGICSILGLSSGVTLLLVGLVVCALILLIAMAA